MKYFRTSYATLQQLASAGRFEDVAGFLVLARHATGLPVAGFEPYKLSGAGVNSIHEKAGVSEETARGVIERLLAQGVIRPTAEATRKAFVHARWEIVQGELDLELPHAFTDTVKNGTATSPLKRLREAAGAAHYIGALEGISDTELRLDALMTLLAVYRHTNLEAFGGLSPRCVYRKWEVKSQTPKKGGIRWGAEPEKETAYHAFMDECLRHTGKRPKEKDANDRRNQRFWNAWHNVREPGLVYEVVCLFDANPAENSNARCTVSLRINDFHAGSISRLGAGDPSLMKTFELTSGAEYGFYTPKDNEREEPEAMWVILPIRRGALVGIWRPRFRSETNDAGIWIEKEKQAISGIQQSLAEIA